MQITTHQTHKGILAHIQPAQVPIASAGDFLDLLCSNPGATVVLDRDTLGERFFDLKTGLAGECLQKVSNYRRRLVILGDFSKEPHKSLRDFIYECNRTGQVVFAPSMEQALEHLR